MGAHSKSDKKPEKKSEMPSGKQSLTGARILWECLEREGMHSLAPSIK